MEKGLALIRLIEQYEDTKSEKEILDYIEKEGLTKESLDAKEERWGRAPLLSAVMMKLLNVILLLIEKGCNINIADNNGRTALMKAVTLNDPLASPQIVTCLIDKKCNMNLKDTIDGYTALMWAIENREYEIASILMERGCNLHLRNERGQTAIEMDTSDFFKSKGIQPKTSANWFACCNNEPISSSTTKI